MRWESWEKKFGAKVDVAIPFERSKVVLTNSNRRCGFVASSIPTFGR